MPILTVLLPRRPPIQARGAVSGPSCPGTDILDRRFASCHQVGPPTGRGVGLLSLPELALTPCFRASGCLRGEAL
jgi:hypothetical protein